MEQKYKIIHLRHILLLVTGFGLIACSASNMVGSGKKSNSGSASERPEGADDSEGDKADEPVEVTGSFLTCEIASEFDKDFFDSDRNVLACLLANEKGEKIATPSAVSCSSSEGVVPVKSQILAADHKYQWMFQPALTIEAQTIVCQISSATSSFDIPIKVSDYQSETSEPKTSTVSPAMVNDPAQANQVIKFSFDESCNELAVRPASVKLLHNFTVCERPGIDANSLIHKSVLLNGSQAAQLTSSAFPLLFSNNFSVSVWIKFRLPAVVEQNQYFTVIDARTSGSSKEFPISIRIGVGTNPGRVSALTASGSAEFSAGSIRNISDDEWHHIMVVKTQTKLSLYIDSVLEQESDISMTSKQFEGPINIGKTSPSSGFFIGHIDELDMWSSGFNANAVSVVYNRQ